MGARDIIYRLLHCHHQNDFCIKAGSDESHFNDLQATTFEMNADSNRGPSAYQPTVPYR